MAAPEVVGNVEDNNSSRSTTPASNNGPVVNNSTASNGPVPNKEFIGKNNYHYNGTSGNIKNNRFLDSDVNYSGNATKHRPNRSRASVSIPPNNGPVPGGTMNSQAGGTNVSGPVPAPNVDPFSEGVSLPPDAIMNPKSGVGYNVGPGGGGDGSFGGGGFFPNRNFSGMPNAMPPSEPYHPNPSGGSMVNSSGPIGNSYPYDAMNSHQNFPGNGARQFGAQYGPGVNQPRATVSRSTHGTDRISSSAPTLSQLLQGQKTPYSFNSPNYSPNDASSGRGPETGVMSSQQYWNNRSNPQMGQMGPAGYNGRNQMGMMGGESSPSHMMQRRPYPGSSMGGSSYPQQQPMPYGPNRQYQQQMYQHQMHNRAPLMSRGQYSQQMPPPYGPQGQSVEYGQQIPSGFNPQGQQQPPQGQQQPPQGQQQPPQGQQQPPQGQQQPPQGQQQPPQGQQQPPQGQQQPPQGQQTPPQDSFGAPPQSQYPSMQQTPHQQQPQQQRPPPQPQQQPSQQQQPSPAPQSEWGQSNQMMDQNTPNSQSSQQTPSSQNNTPSQSPSQTKQQASRTSQPEAITKSEEGTNNRPPSLPELSGCLDDLPIDGDFSNQQSAPPLSEQGDSSNQKAVGNGPPASQPTSESFPASSLPSSHQPSPSPHLPPPSGAKPPPSPVGSPASLVSRTSHSPASAHSGSLTPQPQTGPGGHSQPPERAAEQLNSGSSGPLDQKGHFGRQGYAGPQGSFGSSSAMGNVNFDNRSRPGVDQYSNSQFNEYNSHNCLGPNQGPANSMSPGGQPVPSNVGMNSADFQHPFSGGQNYKPNLPQRMDGPYLQGPNSSRIGMRPMGPGNVVQASHQSQMISSRSPTGSYPPPYPNQQWSEDKKGQFPSPHNSSMDSNRGPGPYRPGDIKVDLQDFNNPKKSQAAVAATSTSVTTQNTSISSMATNTPAGAGTNCLPDSRNTSVTQSITDPVSTTTIASRATEPSPIDSAISAAEQPIIKRENENMEDGTPMKADQIKSELASTPSSTLPPSHPSPMASPSTLSKSSQEDIASDTASPAPPRSGTQTPTGMPSTGGKKNNNNGSSNSNGLLMNRKILKLYEISDDPGRKIFLDTLLKFMDDRGQTIKNTPQVASHVLDLYKLYNLVKEKGGVVKVSKTKQWKQVATTLAIGNSNSAAYTLKKNYIKYLLPYECYFERGGIDPQHVMAEIETGTKSTKKKSQQQMNPSVNNPIYNHGSPYDHQFGPRGPQMKPGYPYPNPNQMHMYGPSHMMSPHRGPMMNNQVPQMPNNMGNNITVRDPFSEMDIHNAPQGSTPYNNNMGNVYGPQIPGQYRPSGGPNNDMFTGGGGMYGVRNSGSMPPNSDPYGLSRRDMGGKPDAFNKNSSMPQGSDPFMGPNQQGAPGSGINMGPSGNCGQFPPGVQERPFLTPSPGQPRQGSPMPPFSSSNSSSMALDQSQQPHPMPGHTPGSFRFPQPGMGTRPATPNSQTYPPPPYSGSGPMPYGNQQQQPPQLQAQTQLPPTSGALPSSPSQPPISQSSDAAPSQQGSPYPEQSSSPFPQKRPAESYSPAAKRPDHGGTHQGVEKTMPMGAMPPFNQPPTAYPDQDRNPGIPPSGYPFPARTSQPTPSVPPQQAQSNSSQQSWHPPAAGYSSSDQPDWPARFEGNHPNYPYPSSDGPKRDTFHPPGPSGDQYGMLPQMTHPPLNNASWGMKPGIRGPAPYSSPRTLQQALIGNYSKMPNKNLKSPPSIPNVSPQNQKKEIIFPADSIEATQPVTKKLEMKTLKDIGSVEIWRVVMALKSGLLAESTWALDRLNILLYDNSTLASFQLADLKGLLEILVDYFKSVLELMYGGFDDCEISSPSRSKQSLKEEGDCDRIVCKLEERFKKNVSKERTEACEDKDLFVRTCEQEDEDEEMIMSRMKGISDSKQIKIDHAARLVVPLDREWDSHEGFRSGLDDWSLGFGDLTCHIINEFEDSKRNGPSLSKKAPDIDGVVDWMKFCSEELRLVKDFDKGDKRLVYASQCRKCLDPNVMVLEDDELRDDSPPMVTQSDAQMSVARRCKCLSNILRSLSFIPINASQLAGHPGLLVLIGRILLLDHSHPQRKEVTHAYYEESDEVPEQPPKEDLMEVEHNLVSKDNWSLNCLHHIREDMLVIINNISGKLDFSIYPEPISLPILDGLLHWSVCLSACALDPFPLLPASSPLSPKRLSLEALAKVSLKDNNVDMILATPPFERLERLFGSLVQYIGDRKEPVLRELAIVLLSSLAQEESVASRSIACQKSSISFLLCYLEDSEYAKSIEHDQSAAHFFQGSDIQTADKDMMRRAASALASLAKVPDNHTLFMQHQTRLLNLSMSPLVDTIIKELIADTLFSLGRQGK